MSLLLILKEELSLLQRKRILNNFLKNIISTFFLNQNETIKNNRKKGENKAIYCFKERFEQIY